jgi:hypothetical protein
LSQYTRTFQVMAYRELVPGADRFSVNTTSPVSRRVVPKRPTFVAGATARVAAEPAATRFGVHVSDLELKPIDVPPGWTPPEGGELLTEIPIGATADAGELSEADMERIREEAYKKLQPKETAEESVPSDPSEVPGFITRRTANGAPKGKKR